MFLESEISDEARKVSLPALAKTSKFLEALASVMLSLPSSVSIEKSLVGRASLEFPVFGNVSEPVVPEMVVSQMTDDKVQIRVDKKFIGTVGKDEQARAIGNTSSVISSPQ